MELEKPISELLFEGDCVVIPGFGGIVGNYHGAEISALHNRFSPPYKQLSFNSRLTGNDGLLAHHIATSLKMPYGDAMEEIAAAVQSWKRRLEAGETVVLARVGSFRLNESGKIEFGPDRSVNYLADSFGLDVFHSPPVQREEAVAKIVRAAKERKVVKKSAPATASAKILHAEGGGTDWRVAAAIPLFIGIGAFLAWTATNVGWIGSEANYAKVEPLVEQTNTMAADAQPREDRTPETVPAQDKPAGGEPETVAEEPVNQTFPDPGNEAEAPAETPATETGPPASSTPPPVETAAYPYHIIGGCFSVPANAEKFMNELRSLGYEAVPAGTNSRGLHRVSYGGSRTKEEAMQALAEIRNSNKAAWVLKR